MKQKQFIFNSSMPHSGSELLQVILNQNPSIYGSPTSPLLEYLYGARSNRTLPEVTSQPTQLMTDAFLGFCLAGMNGYYNTITDKPVVCDKSRGWANYYEWLEQILREKPKIICVVRDLRSIISSFEKNYRKNRHTVSIDNPVKMSNMLLSERVGYFLNTAPVGLSLKELLDCANRRVLRHIHFVRYEDLVADPQSEMDHIYEYLGMETFHHDFSNIEKTVFEHDSVYGVFGNHSVHKEIKQNKLDYFDVLGKPICEQIVAENRWYFDLFYNSKKG